MPTVFDVIASSMAWISIKLSTPISTGIGTPPAILIAEQALGARYKGQHAGTFGLASAISFFPAKVLGCFGDAGAVLVNDKALYPQDALSDLDTFVLLPFGVLSRYCMTLIYGLKLLPEYCQYLNSKK
jgi:hypothetical protein